MNGRVVHVWRKNGREEVRASLETFKGYELAHVRVYVLGEDGAEAKPTQKGIAVKLADLPQLKESVDRLLAEVELTAEAA
jgi:hypothetical protein